MRLRTSAFDWHGDIATGNFGGGSWMELRDAASSAALTVYLNRDHFTDHRACVEELAEVIRKHRNADKPADAV